MCERSITAHGRTGKRRGNGSKHLAAVRTQQPERIVQHQITQEVCQVIGMLSIETVALPVSKHRGVNLHVLQQARLVVIAHGVHERAIACHAIVVQLVRDKRGLARIPRLQRIRVCAKGQNVAILTLKGIDDYTARIGRKAVVGIQERDDRSRGRSDTRIAGARQTAVGLIDKLKARILFAIGSGDVARTIRRAIVNQHTFPIGHILCE